MNTMGRYDDEGEIHEAEVEKAPPSLPSVSGSSVDRRSSSHRSSKSPAPNYYEETRSVRPSERPERHDYHHRSNGDYPRSEKRRRSEDRGRDPRQHRIHYEGSNQDPSFGRRARVSYADIDRSDTRESRYNELDDRRYNDTKRARTDSRSPPRGPRGDYNRGGRPNYYDNRRDNGRRNYDRDGSRYESRNRNSRERSVSERGDYPVPSELSNRDAENQDKVSDRENAGKPAYNSVGSQNVNGRSITPEKADTKPPQAQPEIEEPINIEDDETKQIEERRKKREAIMAKHNKRPNTPLIQTALINGASNPASPMEIVNTPGSPTTQYSPREDTPAGTFTISKHETSPTEENVTLKEINDDGPSAADYDPTMDMQEDNERNEQRRHDVEISSAAYDETKTMNEHVPAPGNMEESNQDQTGKADDDDDFDMFAEGDDDDIFAPVAPKARTEELEAAKGLPVIPTAKQLDESLLDNWDDPEGYYRVISGELLDGRYRVHISLGKGMFSGVVRALDMTTNKDVAIKIIRNNETMRKAGMKEIDILKKLCQADPDDKKHLVRLERYFEHKGHLCIVFENLNFNLREVLKRFGRDVGISLKAVRVYAQQMFIGLSHLRKCNILHADLKPDNVLVNESRTNLKICDLGSASDASENEITPYLVSRFYRAPEIILGMPYDFAIDMWSIGCTLYELYTGKILFTGRTNNQMLRSIMECRGKFSHKLLRRGQFTQLHFDEMLNFRSIEKDKITGKDVLKTMNINKPTRELKQRLMSAITTSSTNPDEIKELNLFIDLLDRCLHLNPEKRCTPAEALKHAFFDRKK